MMRIKVAATSQAQWHAGGARFLSCRCPQSALTAVRRHARSAVRICSDGRPCPSSLCLAGSAGQAIASFCIRPHRRRPQQQAVGEHAVQPVAGTATMPQSPANLGRQGVKQPGRRRHWPQQRSRWSTVVQPHRAHQGTPEAHFEFATAAEDALPSVAAAP